MKTNMTDIEMPYILVYYISDYLTIYQISYSLYLIFIQLKMPLNFPKWKRRVPVNQLGCEVVTTNISENPSCIHGK